jgi:hypothetical protein
MKPPRTILTLIILVIAFEAGVMGASVTIPEPLKPWVDWVLWKDDSRNVPTPFNNPRKPLSTWPTRLNFQADATSGRFDFSVTVFTESWVPLPGGPDAWPVSVKVNGTVVPVVEHDKAPSTRLPPGTHRIEGVYRWTEIPQRITIPASVGFLSLALEGKAVENPAWDASGSLWLRRRSSAGEADKDFLGVKIYSAIEDGIPVWLHTDVELIVSGKSREEEIGNVIPEGWKLASVESQIPVSIDDAGHLKAQVRSGKWTIRTSAFRTDNPTEIRFPAGAKPAVPDELIAFRASPDFRLVDIAGATPVDASQTTFPEKWRSLPVYKWETAKPLLLNEKIRGMGVQRPEGLRIAREWWLNETGSRLTFRDRIRGNMQQIWRLNAAASLDLGSVRSAGVGQLITRDPTDGAPGVEIRTRDIDVEATGLMQRTASLPATGWNTDADSLSVSLNLPPGWRLFALTGADWVHGDWLTAWTLLDLFVLLIFSLAVFRLWGFPAAALGFVALALSYHEPGAPRFVWLALLIPLALLRVVHGGWGRKILIVWKWVTVVVLVFFLAPFVTSQVQQMLYPQLEKIPPSAVPVSTAAAPAEPLGEVASDSAKSVRVLTGARREDSALAAKPALAPQQNQYAVSNLAFDPRARIQTGPGVPDWTWRTVRFGWNGPVPSSQVVNPILIPFQLERILATARVILLLALAGLILNVRKWKSPFVQTHGPAIILALLLFSPAGARAQFPDENLLKTLRDRLTEADDAYPTAADISFVALTLSDRNLSMDAEIQCATRCAVPLPGRLPAWSPLSVTLDGKPESVLRRDDGFLWIVLPPGVHRVRVEGILPDVTEWEWTFLLKPRTVTIDAPAWTFTGIRPNGVPDQQVFFTRKQKTTGGEATYERQNLDTLLAVDRHIEMGLVWQVRTTVSRLAPAGRAVSARIPLVAGENVLTPNVVFKDGEIEARIGAGEVSFTWESELAPRREVLLTTNRDNPWIERWHLLASPVWNISIAGLAPTFEPDSRDLVPVWRPWPGESVALTVSRPEAVAGATMTVESGQHEVTLGNRQRVATLTLSVRCSLGEDFPITLPTDAEVTSLTLDGTAIPVRIEEGKLIVPVRPGEQSLAVNWKENRPLGTFASAGAIQLPVESANINTVINVPDNRWILATAGPLRGPAVRFWSVLTCCLLAAWSLSRMRLSPLSAPEWMLLSIGLTQVPLVAGLTVVAWLLFLEWRGRDSFRALGPLSHNLLQIVLIALTAVALVIFVAVVAEGLLGNPDMFIRGNDSTRSSLRWYSPHSAAILPTPGCVSVSIWWFRFLMLAWALWLAASLIRWLTWGWTQFSSGGCFKAGKKKTLPPALPKT